MNYSGKKILITGGTGTIGHYLVRHLLKEEPKVIRIFSRDEYKQYNMELEFNKDQRLRFLIGDVRDQNRLLRAMEDVDYVFHLAAMKHVPFCEYNPFEAVQTNVIGTQNVIQSAIQAGVKKVLFTSTDKAISPTNTYGATKLTAERLISAAEYQKGPKATVFSSVRFGNVMGSRGSVIPLFKEQILQKGYVTVTHLDMVRYMMTPNQAISVMLKTNTLASGGEVFVLKMPVIRLVDLVNVMIEELSAKHQIKGKIAVKQIGLRPGEKMYEELMTDDEQRVAFETPEMYIVPPFFNESKTTYPDAKPYSQKLTRFEVPIEAETLRKWLMDEALL